MRMKGILLLVLTFFFAAGLRAEVVFSTEPGEPTDPPRFLITNQTGNSDYNEKFAMGFGTGTDAAYVLNSASLKFLDFEGTVSGSLSVSIYTNPGDNVAPTTGTLMGTLSGTSTPTTAGTYLYDDTDNSIVLEGSTNYWLIVTASNVTTGSYKMAVSFAAADNDTGWTSPDFPNGMAYEYWNVDNATFQWDGNGSFSDIGDSGGVVMTMDASPAPEPSTLGLAGVALVGGWAAFRRRVGASLRRSRG